MRPAASTNYSPAKNEPELRTSGNANFVDTFNVREVQKSQYAA